jgi:WD40 repeat protein
MQSSSNQFPYQHGEQTEEQEQSSSTRAPTSAIDAIMARLGLARESDEPASDTSKLAQDLADPSWKIRMQATQKLGKIGKQAPLELLLVALNDQHRSVRAAAARALGRNPRPAAISALVKALTDDEWVVRAEAALALGQMGERAPLEPLLAATRDQDAAVRAAAHKALGEIGAENALEPLDMALQDEDWSVREAATLALGQFDEQTALPLLLDARQDTDPTVRKAAEAILQHFSPESLASLTPPSDSFAQWLERIRSPQRYLASSEEQFADTSIYSWHGKGRTPLVGHPAPEEAHLHKHARALLNWSRKIAHTAEGLLAAVLIACLIVAWLIIASQTRTTPVQVGSNNPSPASTIYRGHDSSVEHVAWAPDGQTIASADTRGTVRIWQTSTGHTLQTYPHLGKVLALTWSSPSILLVAYAEPNQSLQVQQYSIGTYPFIDLLFQQTNLAAIPSVAAWASDNQTLAFDAGDGMVRVWNVVANLNITNFQEKHTLYSELSWSPDNNQIAALSATGQVQIWDAYTGQHITTLENDQSATLVAWVSCSQKSSELLFTSLNGTIMRWWYNYTSQAQKVYPFLTKQTYDIANVSYLSISALALSQDRAQLLLATSDGLVQARDALSGNLIYIYTGHSAQVNDIEWGPDRQHIATASMDTTVQVWQEQ